MASSTPPSYQCEPPEKEPNDQERKSGMLCFVDTPVVTYLDVCDDLPSAGLVCVQWYLQSRSSAFIAELMRRRSPPIHIPWNLRRSIYRSVILQSVGRKDRAEFDALAAKPNPMCDDSILRDIHRTHPGRPDLPPALFKILRAIASKHPSMGYCQGINFVAAHLWLIHGDLAATFYILDALLADYRFRMIDMYLPTLPRLRIMTYQLDRLVEAFLPELNRLMRAYKVGAKFYATHWFMTVFSYDLGPCDAGTPRSKLLLGIWDRFVCDGWGVIIRAALAFLKISEEHLLATSTEEEFLRSLRTLCGRIKSDDCGRVIDLIDFGFRSVQESLLDQLALDVTCDRCSEVKMGEDGELRIRQRYPEVEHARYGKAQAESLASLVSSFRAWFPWSKSGPEDDRLPLKGTSADSDSSTSSFSEYVIP
ncbi:hypothetical protein FOZ62_027661 [Perkinsus olseni]|uniref:Rab-GAP TBC domain-containing protein n=2 Tax=Perkinsus olseni TaxID=32597 RepID=A0A7J6QIT4_PEROL|nr:hypothetical protein FOZ62_027661 [Perkinsus olseni]